MPRILLVDDEASIRHVLALVLQAQGHVVDQAESGEAAVALAAEYPPDVALLDIQLSGMDGVATFGVLHERDPALACIFFTAFGSIRAAITAIQSGAFDYLTKPIDNNELLVVVNRALEMRRLHREVATLREDLASRQAFPGIVGASAAIQDVLRLMGKAAKQNVTVLILGESGTGKELVARGLHRQSPRAAGPFVAVNCSAIPAGLVEAEFFGHEQGAFTDAKKPRIGRFEEANHGTLFLDEIGELPLDAQAKLLRILDDGSVTRVGGHQARPVDVRVVAATNKDLEAAIAHGEFRQDLFYRLNVVTVSIQPLRERRDDILLLVDYFLDRFNTQLGVSLTGVSPEARQVLRSYDWPGNVRELENAVLRAMVVAEGSILQSQALPIHVHRRLASGAPGAATDETDGLTLADAVERASARVERGLIEAALMRHHGNRTATAKALGVDRKTLRNRMLRYRLREWDADEGG